MMKLYEFYRKFEDLPKEKRFEPITPATSPTSFFVIFQQLGQVRSQIKYFEKREEELLHQAEEAFNKMRNG